MEVGKNDSVISEVFWGIGSNLVSFVEEGIIREVDSDRRGESSRI